MIERQRIEPNGDVIFNDTGINADFRVESSNRTHALFVDANHSAGGAVKLVSANATITSVQKGAYFAENNDNFVHMVLVNESTAASHSLMFLNRQSSDGTLIEFVETHKLPIIAKLGWYMNLKGRPHHKSLPNWMINTMSFNRIKD